jgi:Leu/Phe-tRNA-protein transferase
VKNDHLVRLGAIEISHAIFQERLAAAIKRPTRQGRWDLV